MSPVQSVFHTTTPEGEPPGASVAPGEDDKPSKEIIDARQEYNEILENAQVAHHFMNVSILDYPRRRVDGSFPIPLSRREVIEECYKKDDVTQRWITKDGKPLILESEIFDTIVSYLRGAKNYSKDRSYLEIRARVEGIQLHDVRQAVRLWDSYGLGNLVPTDDRLWGGVPTTKVPDIVSLSDPDETEDASTEEEDEVSEQMINSSATSDQDFGGISLEEPHIVRTPGEAPRVFHPRKRDALRIGSSGIDGSAVWLTITERKGAQAGTLNSVLYDSNLHVRGESELHIRWDPEFQYPRFPKTDGDERTRKSAQRKYIYNNIMKKLVVTLSLPRPSHQRASDGPTQAPGKPVSKTNTTAIGLNLSGSHEASTNRRRSAPEQGGAAEPSSEEVPLRSSKRVKYNAGSPKPSKPTSNTTIGAAVPDPTKYSSDIEIISSTPIQSSSLRPATRADPTIHQIPFHSVKSESRVEPDEPSAVDATHSLPTHAIARTSFLVSATNQPSLAPINVPMSDCLSLEGLFSTLIEECDLKGKAASDLTKISAEYTWLDGRQHLIRKDRPRDWAIFVNQLRKAWEKQSNLFVDDDCEVKMVAHVL